MKTQCRGVCLLIIFVFVINLVKAQFIGIKNQEFRGNIKSIIEKSVKYSGAWREFEFDDFSKLKEKKYFRNNSLVQKEVWSYFNNDTLSIIKQNIEIENVRNEMLIEKTYFDSNKKLIKQEIYSERDGAYPYIIFENFVYEGDDIVSYNSIFFHNRDTTVIDSFKVVHQKNLPSITIHKTDNKNISSFVHTLKYDKNGFLKSEVVDYNNPEVVLGGVLTWSRARPDKYRIDYKNDKQGNWIAKYAVTRFRKIKIEERVITYW